MKKVVISFYKKLYDVREDFVYMSIDGLDETAIELFRLKPEERNDRLVEIMKERGVIVQIGRQVAEANGCAEEVFPARDTHPPIEKKADQVKDIEQVGLICEKMYRRISELTKEFLSGNSVSEGDLRIWFPVMFKGIEVLEQMIDEEITAKRYDGVEDMCNKILDQYSKIFDLSQQKIGGIQKVRKDIFDRVANFVEPAKKETKVNFDFDDIGLENKLVESQSQSKQLEDDFFADIPIKTSIPDISNDDVLGLL